MTRHLIVGAGAVGRATANALLAGGHEVTLVNRSGTGPDVPGATRTALDASDTGALVAAAGGHDVVYNCMNPPYHRWAEVWPPLAEALLAAATGRTLVTMGNLYVYGRVDAPMTEQTPERPHGTKGGVRAEMTRRAMAAHADGRLRYAEARASDFFGPGTDATSYLTQLVLPRASKGRTVFLLTGRADVPHTWTYVPDVGRTLATLGTDDRALGRVWHVPSAAPRTFREAAADVAGLCGQRPPRVVATPWPSVRTAGIAVPFLRELAETRHQFTEPFVLDSSAAGTELGLAPTPWDVALQEALVDYRA